jgi:hypothetical protein
VSFCDTARAFALEKAAELENKARSIGIMRSVDATEAARWLRDMATAIRNAAGPDEPPLACPGDLDATIPWNEPAPAPARAERKAKAIKAKGTK